MRRQLQAPNRESKIGNEVSLDDTTPNQNPMTVRYAGPRNQTVSDGISAQSLEGVTLLSYEILSLIKE